MKKTITLILLALYINSFGQKLMVKPPIPITPISSLELKTSIKLGKELSFLIKEKKTIRNGEYIVMVRKKKEKKSIPYKYIKNNEGNDTPNYGLKGIGTNIYLQGKFFKGYKNGFWKTTYKNKLVKTINYNHGLVIGRYRVYNLKGNILYKTTFGTKGNGRFEDYYYKTGLLKQEGNFRNGKKQGEWCDYDEQGNTKKITYYENGTPVK